MKGLNFLEKLLFLVNSLLATLLVITYLVPYINPINLPSLAVLSLGYPALVSINIVFIILWVLKLKKQFLLSTIVVLCGIQHLQALFSFHKNENISKNEITVLSYNVRQFNRFNWIKSTNVKDELSTFINNQNADIVCFQEFSNSKGVIIDLPKIIDRRRGAIGLAIFSKHPVIASGSFDCKNTVNNIIYADLKIKSKIIRVYNLHLQSFGLDLTKDNYGSSDKEALLKKYKKVFKHQAQQVTELQEHLKKCPYPSIIAGDFNNTAFSWNYKQLTKNHKDAFVEAGSGFGKSYNHKIPFRIDFILPSNNMIVNSFTTFKTKLSDHFPIMTKINLTD